MKMISSIILAFLCVATHGAAVREAKNSGRISPEFLKQLQRRVRNTGGCNANVCFAIDGSGSITGEEFDNEKFFLLDVVAVIGVDQPVEVAAVQYATSNSPITPFTSNTGEFNIAVSRASQTGGLSFVSGGLTYCASQVRERPGEANKIVLLGDGRSNIGRSAIRQADRIRQSFGTSICVVGAGFADNTELLGIAGGDKSKVFEVDSFFDTFALTDIIDDLVKGICEN